MATPYLVGITGGSGSGKTYFLHALMQSFEPSKICLISQDNYYRPRNEQPLDENGVQNFDTPDSINVAMYAADILKLKNGETVNILEYTFNNPNATPKQLTFHSAPIIVVEGIFVLYFQEIAKLLDLRVFINAEPHIKLKRRIQRDKDERGYPLEDVLYRFEKHVMPTYKKYIEPFKQQADIIIPNNKNFDKGLAVLMSHLRERATAWQTP